MTQIEPIRRGLAALLVVPLSAFLCGGPIASVAYAQAREREQAQRVLARQLGIDESLFFDPDGHARAERAAGVARRKAALAKLPKSTLPDRVKVERARIERAQAIRTLGGVGRALRQGRKPALTQLSPAAMALHDEARRKRAEWRPRERPPLQMMQRTALQPRAPRTEAPREWRDATRRDLESLRLQPMPPRRVNARTEPGPATRAPESVVFNAVVPRSQWPEAPLPVQLAPDDPPLPVTPASLLPTIDAPSDHPRIVAQATELGNDPIRIYNFVHDRILNELYAGSKKGAVGTLREGAGNDVDQSSLLIALLRAAGVPARYETGNLAFTPSRANEYAGVAELSVAAALLSSAGVPNAFFFLGAGQGIGLQIEHTWVRAQVPNLAYRGTTRPGADSSWVHLAPAIKNYATNDAVDLRDSVTFDFDAYVSTLNPLTPLEVYEAQLREYVRASALNCPTLDDAQKNRRIAAASLELLPSELPVRRIATLAAYAEVPASERHTARFTGQTSQGAPQLTYSAPVAALWGKSLTLVYAPATATDAAIISQYGGLAQTPAYKVKMRATLKVDGTAVATGAAETPGLDQRMFVELTSPATGQYRVEHPLIVSGVYAFALDPGLVPSDLLSERAGRYPGLTGDDLEAEKLYVAALTYFHEQGRARDRIAGLHWHRIYKEVEEAAAMVAPRVEELNGVPLSVSRDIFTFDAPGLRFGDFSIDGDHQRTVRLTQLVGYQSSVLEHRMAERFRGPKAFSAVKLVQRASADNIPVLTFSQGDLEEALAQISWPLEREERLRDFANLGYTVQAPVFGHNDPDLGQLYGFIAVNPATGVGAYIVGSLRAETHGAEGQNQSSSGGAPGCGACGETGSPVHLLSGNLPLEWTDLTLPARGIPLAFTRVYNTIGGWTHNLREKLTLENDGSITWFDERGISWRFLPDTASGVWQPPPKQFQRIVSIAGGYEMRFKHGLVRRYDTAGRLVAREDPNGHQVSLQYDGSGRLSLVTANAGQGFSFGYDALHRITSVTDTAGRAVSFGYEGTNITSAVDVLGHERTYTYDAFGRMHSRSDARGNLWRYEYDDVGRIVRLEDPLGAADTYAYDYANRTTMHVDRRGEALVFQLNDLAKIVRRVDPLGNEQVLTWDERGNKTSERDSRGNVATMMYDSDGNLLSRTEPTGATTTFDYGAFARVIETTDALAQTTRHTYDAAGNLLTTTDALENVTTHTYTGDGLPETVTRPGGATTQYVYDAQGNVVSILSPEGQQTTMTYSAAGHVLTSTQDGATMTMTVNANGQVLTREDAQGARTRYEYDDDGNRTLEVDAEQRSTVFEYDSLSRVVATTNALGQVARSEYDAEGRVIARIGPRGFRSEMEYDAIGRLVESCDPLGNCTNTAYCAELSSVASDVIDALGNLTHVECDNLGREASRTDPMRNVTRTAYDLLGRRSEVTDPAGNKTTFGYDALNRLTSVTDPLLGVTQYGYDARGNRSSVTDANSFVTTFAYDLDDQLIRETTPIDSVTEYGYDAAGNRASKLDGKTQLTSYAYDANRRLELTTYADATTATFDYDPRGNRIAESNQDSTRSSTYDALGRLRSVYDVETGRTIEHTYDASGNRASMRVSPDDETTTYAWDARGLLIRMTDPEGGEYRFGYDDLGRRIATTYPNGMTLTMMYDAASRIVSMIYRDANAQVIDSFAYAYDTRGNRTAKVLRDGTAELYTYDALSRLTRVAYPSGREVHYRYDAVGNRLEMIEGTSGGLVENCAGDQDCDGVMDAADNCPAITNASQQNTDSPPGALNAPGASAIWTFEETSGTVAQDSVGSNHGTLANGVVRTAAGKRGSALQFDGGNDSVNTPLNINQGPTTPGVTFEAWVYPTSTSGGRHHVFGTDDGNHDWSLLREGGTWFVFTGDSSQSTGMSVDVNQWQHVAAVFTPGVGIVFYKNGVSRLVPQISYETSDANLALGRNPGFGEYFDGRIDEAAVYPRALTELEVRAHYQIGFYGDQLGDACDPCVSSMSLTCAPSTCLDQDGDGYGQPGSSACSGGVAKLDCNDANTAVHPGVVDACDDVDNDCDGRKDEGCLSSPQSTTYQYNAFNQLLSATGPTGITTFVYDDNGNQTSKVEPSGTTTYVWDARDRLVELVAPTGTQRFGYDVNNLRVQTQGYTGTRRILLDGAEELAEYASGTWATRYDHDPSRVDSLLAQSSPASTTHVVGDALGSVHGLTDASSAIVTRYSYDVYGGRNASAESVPTKWGFTGRVHESGDSNVTYFRARYLDTATGRFIQRDPIRGRDPYLYVGAAPTRRVDPSGMVSVDSSCDAVPGGRNVVERALETLKSDRRYVNQHAFFFGTPSKRPGGAALLADSSLHYQDELATFNTRFDLNRTLDAVFLSNVEVICSCDDDAQLAGFGEVADILISNGEYGIFIPQSVVRDGLGPGGRTGGLVPVIGHELAHVSMAEGLDANLADSVFAVPTAWDMRPAPRGLQYVDRLTELVAYEVEAVLGHNPRGVMPPGLY